MNSRALLVAGLAVVLAVVVVAAIVVVGAGVSDDGDGGAALASPTVPGTIVTADTPTPSPTLETAPEATPTPVLSAEEQARALTLEEAPAGMLQFTTDGPYVVPGDALGAFFLNIETQQIEGWFDLAPGESPTIPIAISGDNRFTLFERPRQSFSGGTIFPAGYYLGDRETRSVRRWPGDAEVVFERTGFAREIASRGDLVLFRVPVQDGDDWLAVLNVADNEVVAAFRAEATLALFSQAGDKLALVSLIDTGSAWTAEVWGVEVQTGNELFREPLDFEGYDLEGTLELLDSRDGESFTFVANPVKTQFRGIAARYGWDGRILSQMEGPNVFVSPFGDYVALREPVLPSEEVETSWNVYTAFEMTDGSPMFRIVGGTRYLGLSNDNRWLADGSGLAVLAPDGTDRLLRRDGSVQDLPGIPSPIDANVFAVGGDRPDAGAVDAAGNPIALVTFQGGVRDLVAPWGDPGDEVRLMIPHGGHGGPGLVASIVQPYVEQAPFAGPAPLQLSDVAVGFGLVNLYSEPGGDVLAQVEAPHRVFVQEVVRRCSGDFDRYGPVSDCEALEGTLHRDFVALVTGAAVEEGRLLAGSWARVTTPQGQQGWLLLQVNGIGI